MNRIYRRLWSTARQCWVVTSELASTKRKPGASTRPLRRSTAAALVMLFGAAGTAHAERNLFSCYTASQGCVPTWAWVHDYQWISGNGRFVLLTGNAITFEGDYATAFGNNITSYGDRNSAFGYGAGVAGGYATAVGAFANATGIGATAIGNDANAYGGNAVALGSKATVITGAGVSGIAIGADSRAGTQGWTGAVALGGEASASHDSIALGYKAHSSAANSVALGRGSQATEAYTVSVGNGSTKRRIVNVADGTISSSSTDAVNGRQLQVAKNDINAAKATATTAKTTADQALANSRVVTQASASGTVRVGGDNTGTTVSFANKNNATRYLNGIRNGALSTTSTDAVTGQQLFATNANVTKAQSAADAAQSAANSIKTTADSALSKANGLAGLVSQASATGSVRLGGENTGTVLDVRNKANANRRISGLADATLNTTSTEAVTGKQLTATNANVSTVQNTATAAQTAATGARTTADSALGKANVLGGLVSQASATGNVRLGGDNTGTVLDVRNKSDAGRKVTGLSDGTLSSTSTDAVTGKQLTATNTKVTTAQTTATAAQTAAAGAKTTADTALGKANVLGGLVSQAAANGNVRLGGDNTGTVLDVRNKSDAGRKVTGLSDGTLSSTSTDAVTGKQLTATNTKVTTAQNTATAAQTAAAGAKTTADTALGKATVLGGLVSQASATGNVRLGGDNTGTVLDVRNKSDAGRKITGLSDGTLSSTSTDAVTGKQLSATNANVTTAQNTATAAQTAAAGAKTTADTALGKANALGGLVSQASATGNVRLGGENTGTVVDVANKDGAKRRVNNVANGVVSSTSTDVVTGQQLHATNQAVSTQGQSLVLHGQQLATHTQSLAAQDQRVSTNRTDIDQLRSDVDNFDPDLDGVVKFSADRRLVDMDGARVSGVAAGDASSAASLDAVNGGQLFETNRKLEALAEAGQFLTVGSGGPASSSVAGLIAVAIGDSTRAEGEGAVALGSFAVAEGKNSVALGRASNVEAAAEDGFALGVRASVKSGKGVAVGAGSSIGSGAFNSVAIGAGSVATEQLTVSFGEGALKRRLVNVARGTKVDEAATIGQLNDGVALLGSGAGVDATGHIISPTYSVQGGMQNNVGDALSALDGAVIRSGRSVESIESQLRSTFQQSPSARADGIAQLNLAGAQGMVLSNLADGRIAAGSRDAVTGSQLYAAKQDIARNRSELNALLDASTSGASTAGGTYSVIDYGGATLTGVADGMLSPEGKDVVNGGQLFATNSRVASLEGRTEMLAVGSELHRERAEAGIYGVALGNGAQASMDSEGGTAIGSYTSALGKNSVALGRGAYVSSFAENGYALGAGARVDQSGGVALGSYAIVTDDALESVALGAYSYASERGVISFGNDSLKRRLTNVAHGVAQNDAATIGQLRGALSTLGSNIDANGNVTTPGFNLQGQHHTTVNDALTTLDAALVTTDSRVDRVETHLRSVFQESPSTRSDGAAQLTLAGANGMVISNVANGLIAAGSREAVNGGQLHAVQQQLNGRMDGLEQRVDGKPQARAMATASADAGAPTPTPTSSESAAATPPVANEGDKAVADSGSAPSSSPTPQPKSKKEDAPAPTPQVDTAELEKMLARANEYTDGAIKGVEQRLDKMDKRFNRMAAMSSAQTAMAMNTAGLATYNRLGAGVGYAEGESAMAVGYQRVLNEKGSATFSLNGAFTNSGEQSVGVGVGIGW